MPGGLEEAGNWRRSTLTNEKRVFSVLTNQRPVSPDAVQLEMETAHRHPLTAAALALIADQVQGELRVLAAATVLPEHGVQIYSTAKVRRRYHSTVEVYRTG